MHKSLSLLSCISQKRFHYINLDEIWPKKDKSVNVTNNNNNFTNTKIFGKN